MVKKKKKKETNAHAAVNTALLYPYEYNGKFCHSAFFSRAHENNTRHYARV